MSLYRLSQLSIAGCLAGLVLLLIVSVESARQMLEKQAEVAELLELHDRINDFSAASHNLVLSGADPGLWRAYRAEAQLLRERLERLGERHPAARKAARRMQAMIGTVAAALDVPGVDAGTGARLPDTDGALGSLDVLPARSRIVMQQVAGHGIALDTALDDALRERQQAIAHDATWIGATLAGSALLFGALCVVAFGLIHGRVARPARALVATLENIRAGNTHARAPVTGSHDELSRLAETLNRMLDEGQAGERALRERQQHLEQTLAELETARDRLLRAQRAGRVGSWEVDLADGRLEWSDQVFEIFGVGPGEFDGTEEAFFELVHPDDREWFRGECADWAERDGVLDAEHRIVRPDGEIRWVRERARVFAGADGQPARMTGVVQDVNDLRQLNARLRQYERLVEHSTDRFCIIDSSFHYVLSNEAYAALYGMDRKAIEGSHVRDIVGSEFFEREVRERVQRCLAGEIVRFEVQRTYDNAGTVHFLIEYYPLPGPDGTIHEAAAVLTDITEQSRLDERAQQFQQLIEGTEDLCGIADADYRYLWVNQAYLDAHGLQREQMEGRIVSEILDPEYFEEVVKPHFDRCLAGEVQRFETEREFPGLGRRKLLARYYPITAPVTGEHRIGSVITDVTDIRAAEAALADQARLLQMAGQAARFGAWSIELASGRIEWSDMVAEIHGMPHGYAPDFEEGIRFFAPEERERVRALFSACAEHGRPYDAELQIVDADGQRIWVRAIGMPVYDDSDRITRVQGAVQDISEQRHLLDRLHAYRQLIENSEDLFALLDADCRYLVVNQAYADRHGREVADIEGRHMQSIVGPEFFEQELRAVYERCLEGEPQHFEFEFDYPQRGHRNLLEHVYPVENPQGQVTHIGIVISDVTAMKQVEHKLRESRDQLSQLLETRKALIDSLPAHIAMLDADSVIVDVNDQWRHFGQENRYSDEGYGVGVNYIELCEGATGDCADEAAEVAAGLRDVLAGRRDVFALEYPCHSPEQQRWFRAMFNRLAGDDSNHIGAVAMHIDITERKLAEQELNRLAFEDLLTGLPSRTGFAQRLDQHLGAHGWQPDAIVAMVDVVDLRDINDAHGYDSGDQLLTELGRRLSAQAGEHGLPGRTGGDEFILYLDGSLSTEIQARLQALSAALEQPYPVDGGSVEISLRIGYTVLGERERPVEGLMREAELSLFENRKQDSAQLPWIAYSESLDERTHERIRLTRELRDALAAEEFELHYQPKVNLDDGSLIAAEALLRWNHPERGLQPPGLFIPVAEQSQLIGPIGDWALRAACRQLREWRDADLDIVQVAVNVSLVQFTLGGFPAKVRAALAEFAVDPAHLSLEITESVFERVSDELLAEIRELHDVGVRLSLDDFGTGYSSLLYLQRYPFDEIKIDQGFVFRLLDDPYSHDIVRTVMGLAHALGAEAVAEGIESPAVRDVLLELGCTVGQGYYYSVPLEAEDFRWLLERRSNLPLQAGAKA